MKDSNIERLLRLVQKTGDTLVVASEGGDPVVLMPIERYESFFAEDSVEFRQVPPRQVRPVEKPVHEPHLPIEEDVQELVELPDVREAETPRKEVPQQGGGEERFYLEPLD